MACITVSASTRSSFLASAHSRLWLQRRLITRGVPSEALRMASIAAPSKTVWLHPAPLSLAWMKALPSSLVIPSIWKFITSLVQEQYGDLEKGLLIAVGDEIGYQALDGLVYAETPTWADIVEVVNDLVENKADNNFEIVGIDTADEMIKLAKEEVKRIHKKQKGSAAEFNACLGGYGAPRDKVTELVDDILAKLRKAGYGIVIIGHTKLKDVKEKNGDEYQQLTSNLNADYDGIFANKADIVMTIAVEKNIDEAKRIKGTTRYMWFRTDGFVDAGGRFSEMPERIEYGATNYIEAFEEGVKKAIKGVDHQIICTYLLYLNTTLQLLKKSNAQGTFRSIISLQINPYERE